MFIKTLFFIFHIIIFNSYFVNLLLAEETFINFEDGSSYQGEVFDGQMEGKGIFISSANIDGQKLTYDGDFKKGKFEGKGTLEFYNGDSYSGDFIRGLMHGRGILKYKNGLKLSAKIVCHIDANIIFQ